MIDAEILALAESVLAACRAAGLKVATAESCTGGLIAAALTAIAGSSDVVDRGFVTYSNAAKTEMLGVPPDLIAAAGAVSEAVARRMAEGALARSAADLAVSVTGRRRPRRRQRGKAGGAGMVRSRPSRCGQPPRCSHVFPGRSRGAVRRASVRGGRCGCCATRRRSALNAPARRAAWPATASAAAATKKQSPITSSTSL